MAASRLPPRLAVCSLVPLSANINNLLWVLAFTWQGLLFLRLCLCHLLQFDRICEITDRQRQKTRRLASWGCVCVFVVTLPLGVYALLGNKAHAKAGAAAAASLVTPLVCGWTRTDLVSRQPTSFTTTHTEGKGKNDIKQHERKVAKRAFWIFRILENHLHGDVCNLL